MQISSASLPGYGSHAFYAPNAQEPDTNAAELTAQRPLAIPPSPESAGPESGTANPEPRREDAPPAEGAKQKAENPLQDPASPEYAQVKELAARDTEVRAHEQAHLSAAGKYATGGMSFSYQTGPDGKRYAIGGEVGIDVSEIPDDPAATIAKMQVVQRAAMAPAEPSGQDMRVAAQAAQTAAAARAELAAQQFTESQGGNDAPQSEGNVLSSTAKQAQHSYAEQQRPEASAQLDLQA